MKTNFRKVDYCPLDIIKPYKRPKLSDPAHGTQRLQPRRSRRVRCSAWLGDGRFGVGVTAESKSVTEKRTESEHKYRNGFEGVNVGDEIQQAAVGNEWSEAPLGK